MRIGPSLSHLVPLRPAAMSFTPAYTYINASDLAAQLRNPAARRHIAIVDARDDDFVGGHILGALNVPTVQLAAGDSQADKAVADLVKQLEGKSKVVFHCHLSQARGPKAARIYSEARAAATRDDGRAAPAPQEILVLRDGFAVFGPMYKVRRRVCVLLSAGDLH